MANIEIYTITYCPSCIKAKKLLGEKKVPYKEINLDEEPKKRDEMLKRTEGKHTVPQIFINNKHIGGCDDLQNLSETEKLDALLK